MSNNAPSLLVAVIDQAAIVKVNGRANFTTSVNFKRLVSELWQRGFETFVLDLSDCITMDSTFLGVLAGTALRLTQNGRTRAMVRADHGSSRRLRLLNPNQRVADLLDNLGVSDLFVTICGQASNPLPSELEPSQEIKPTKEELSRTCLEAHKLLMQINPNNVEKFKDVAQFLAEDLGSFQTNSETPSQASSCGPENSKH